MAFLKEMKSCHKYCLFWKNSVQFILHASRFLLFSLFFFCCSRLQVIGLLEKQLVFVVEPEGLQHCRERSSLFLGLFTKLWFKIFKIPFLWLILKKFQLLWFVFKKILNLWFGLTDQNF